MSTSQSAERLVAERYRLVEPVGQGGMGRVWLAEDVLLGRDVALKELTPPPGLSVQEQHDMRLRSLREARALARLNHHHVVQIFDVVRPADGDPWLVMEYVTGRSLQQALMAEGPLPPPRVAQIGVGILGALQAAHRAGVVHRDVKPGNVLLSDDGRVLLTDFGLATVPGDPHVTQGGEMFGSPAYMAPERALDGTAGNESDLWSLGATLYTAVEGHPPFDRATAVATLSALTMEDVPEPQRAGSLAPALVGLLVKDPARRLTAPEAMRLLQRATGAPTGSRGRAPVPRPRSDGPPTNREQVEPPTNPRGSAAMGAVSGAPGAPASGGGAPRATPRPPAAAVGTAAPGAWPVGVAPVPEPVQADSRRGRLRRGVVMIGVLVVVALVAGVLLVNRLDSKRGAGQVAPPGPSTTSAPAASGGSGAATASASAPASASPSPTPSPSAAAPSTSSVALPPGWTLQRDGSGFAVPVPDGWIFSRDSGGRAQWRDPAGTRLLLLDQTRTPRPDPVQDWLNNEAARRGGYANYHRIRIAAVPYWDSAADWEFTYTIGGAVQHVLNRGFVTAPDQAYSIYWSTPDSQWAASQGQLKVILTGFQPARS